MRRGVNLTSPTQTENAAKLAQALREFPTGFSIFSKSVSKKSESLFTASALIVLLASWA
jgi:hypothetical protein